MSSLAVHPFDLEPSLVAEGTYSTRRRRARIDAAALLSVMVSLLYVLPATLIVPNMTFAGRPALLLAFVLWCWWLMARLSPRLTMTGPQPLRWAALLYLLSILLSYLAGMLRGLPSLEANAQNFSVLVCFEFLGVILMAADGLPNWGRLRGVVRVYVWSCGFMAAVGLVQSTFKYNLAQYLVLPGLQLKEDVADFQARGDGGLFRVAGTATHYIEFATVMAMAVPFAIHFAMFAPERRVRALAGLVALMCTAVIPMAISRTGVLALGTAIVVMLIIGWDWRTRYKVLVLGGGITGALVVLKPGLLGTIGSMFGGVKDDPSIQGRTEDYAFVAHWFSQRPWLGRGPGTLIPDLYRILDDQWLYTLVTLGLMGVIALAVLHITCITVAGIALRRCTRAEDKNLCAALISTEIVSILVSATFDSLSFTTFAFTLALNCGLCGAVWRFTHPQRTVRTSTVRWLAD